MNRDDIKKVSEKATEIVGSKYINPNRSRQDNTHATEIWNAAIEEAAKLIEEKFDFLGEELLAAIEIRKLKK